MSVAQIVGLAVTAGVLGGAGIAALIMWVTSHRRQSVERRRRLIDAYARWLAAKMTLSRASASFVAAFRALRAETRDSAYFSLRVQEAQRARAHWCDAMRELDLAEASLRAWAPSPALREQLSRFDRVGAQTLRAAINGDERQADRLVQTLRAEDRAAIEFVETASSAAGTPARQSILQDTLVRAASHMQAIVDGWGKR